MTRCLLRSLAMLSLFGLAGCATSNSVVNFSHYDEAAPNFAGLKRGGIAAVIHEATYPPSAGDPRYAERQAEAVHQHLLWGAYHFGNATNPVQQADFFVDFVRSEALAGPTPPAGVLMVLDFEQNTHYPGGTMSVPQALIFLQRVKERTGRFPGLYSNENRIRTVLNSPSLSEESKRALRETWLWAANYHHEPAETAPWSRWTMWQYTGDGVCDLPRGSYPMGIANYRCAERNIFHGSAGDLRQFWVSNAWRPR